MGICKNLFDLKNEANFYELMIFIGPQMCLKDTRKQGSLACAYLSQEVKDAFSDFMGGYSVGYNCMCTGMWSWATRQGHNLPITGSATHTCGIGNLSSTNWNLADLITDLNGQEL